MFELIKDILGRPYYECKYGIIYNMDCEKALALLPVTTFPPRNEKILWYVKDRAN